jgi:ABC-type glycerol-3-phosphate transport system permease component
MSVVRKGPRVTAIRILTYSFLVVTAVIVIFPFLVAFTNSFKRAEDLVRYPPSLVPRGPETRVDPESGELQPLYSLPDEDGTWALVENGVSLLVLANPDDPSETATVEAGDVERLDDQTVTIDGAEKPLYVFDDDGVEQVWFRDRTTIGARFQSVDDPAEERVGLVNDATRQEQFAPRPANYADVWSQKNLERALTNTVFVTMLVVAGQVVTSILGGYAFSRLRFKGRSVVFLMYLGSVMIPFVVLIIPLYQLMVQLGWVDNLVALIIPFIFTAYGTFLMRQFFLGIPEEIEEAALLDGASRWTILWRVFVPLAKPAIATLATFGFLYAWNSFVWPLVIINSGNQDNLVLSLALSTLGGRGADSPSLVFAGVMLAMAPPVLVFLLAQRYFVENQASSGIK